MKTIKKYWKLIVGAITGIFGLLFLISKKNTNKKLDESKKKIASNNTEINKLDGKIEYVKEEKTEVKKSIKKQKEKIKNIKKQKTFIPNPPKVALTKEEAVKAAKENILRRTRK